MLGPELLLGSEVGADLLDGLVRGGNVGALRGLESNTHGWSFRDTSPLLSTIALEEVIGSPFWEWTPNFGQCRLEVSRFAMTAQCRTIMPH